MRKLLVAASAAALMALAGAAHAGVVDFDDAQGNSIATVFYGNGQTFSDEGLDFTNDGSWYMYIWNANPNGNGTNANIFAGFSGSNDVETITKTGGGSFTLNSIDLSISWYDGNPTETVLINGNPLTITQTYTTYNLNLANVSSVTISGVGSGGGYWQADNINFSASGAPEPATWATMLLGFFGAGATLRSVRRKYALA